jgi:hypothetical protein
VDKINKGNEEYVIGKEGEEGRAEDKRKKRRRGYRINNKTMASYWWLTSKIIKDTNRLK